MQLENLLVYLCMDSIVLKVVVFQCSQEFNTGIYSSKSIIQRPYKLDEFGSEKRVNLCYSLALRTSN